MSGTLGSWDQRRGVVDVTTPLTASGDVRARFVGGYDDSDSYLDRYAEREKFGYGVIDADVTDRTTLSVGYDYQSTHASSPTWGGLPLWYSDGSETDYSRSFSVAPDWSYYDFEASKVFAQLDHRFDNGWELRGTATHEETDMDGKLAAPYYEPYFSSPDPVTGQGPFFYTGWNRGEREVDSVDGYAKGPFALFGRAHELASWAAATATRAMTTRTPSSTALLPAISITGMARHRMRDGRISRRRRAPVCGRSRSTASRGSRWPIR